MITFTVYGLTVIQSVSMIFLTNLKIQLLRFVTYSIISISTIDCSEEKLVERSDWLPEIGHFLIRDTTALSLFVISDWGFNGSEDQMKVAGEMANTSAITGLDMILTCGDNFQVSGVKSTSDILWTTNYEDVYSDSTLNVPWYPALGNHDYDGNPMVQIEYSLFNDQWNMPSKYYTFAQRIDTGSSLRVIVMDTPGLLKDYDALADQSNYTSLPQFQWLVNKLSNCTEEWIIVTGHHPVYSAGSYHGDTKLMKSIIKPLFDHYGVDIYISGHDHDFEHARDEEFLTDYIVTGTGGQTRDVGSSSYTVFSVASLGFTYISLTPEHLKLYFITGDGQIAYHFSKTKTF